MSHMSGNTFGKLFAVTNFGESHGPAIGCVIDGCPPGLALSEADIQIELEKLRAEIYVELEKLRAELHVGLEKLRTELIDRVEQGFRSQTCAIIMVSSA